MGGDLLAAASRVHSAVDRRFNRSGYDAQRTVEAFTQRLRDQVDVDALTFEVADVAAGALHPAHVSVWLAVPGVEVS